MRRPKPRQRPRNPMPQREAIPRALTSPAAAARTKNHRSSTLGRRPPYKWPTPDMPSYKPEYAAKVEALFKNQYGASTPDDPQYDCKPMGVPRASMVPLQFV